ncbi:MAG: hypothetical protein IPL39_08405 [Opitutaceae bacterium]|nr:hypothetical protein [Opitutaceae bacterium]
MKHKRLGISLVCVAALAVAIPWGVSTYRFWLPRFQEPKFDEPRGDGLECVSIVRLLAAPNELAGRRVRIEGFLWIEYEGNAIYLHEEDYRRGLYRNGLRLELTQDEKAKEDILRKLSGHYVMLEGVFVGGRSQMQLWSGTIRDISRVQLEW